VTQGRAASVFREWVDTTLAHRHEREIYQTSTMGALLDGVYDGDVTVGSAVSEPGAGEWTTMY
jgi:acetolactate decarboxylase